MSQNQILHLDLKPANFAMSNGIIKLLDFGISSRIQKDRTHVTRNDRIGTFDFMPPEAILVSNGRDKKPRADYNPWFYLIKQLPSKSTRLVKVFEIQPWWLGGRAVV